MGLDSDCESTVVIYAALGACANFDPSSQINLYCSDNETIAQVFSFANQFPTSTFFPSSSFIPTVFNGTLPSLDIIDNTTLVPTLFNATLPSLVEMSTTQMNQQLCADEAFCQKWMFSPTQCQLIATIPVGTTLTSVYGIMDACFTDTDMMSSTTMIELPSTTLDNTTATEPTIPTISTSTSSTSTTGGTETTSAAVRPSLLFTVGMFFSFFFLVAV